ncbi:MAG: hypothetical protein K2G55_20715 [Lachnospiraceae bacterium]|nr:hypothetical protein [Lachnospiraceae bacterium]MDE7200496.1 hypothetical protein [Lachnospiraceae bacterium]
MTGNNGCTSYYIKDAKIIQAGATVLEGMVMSNEKGGLHDINACKPPLILDIRNYKTVILSIN